MIIKVEIENKTNLKFEIECPHEISLFHVREYLSSYSKLGITREALDKDARCQ
ncbi:hypothetical protein LLT3_14215 [Lactococcus cremoris subsp. cremoris TIFN3]|uniref:Uncharacterized protein n=1 Tax=Lactococcus cremoris subsp. cremoris TIFN3 TaxID=1234873 RepID=T0VID8_LACLC|nr:hypothetical protein LLT3_14215 [Lactococcus cremoris subsp. cremoris TIFN3]